MGKVLTALGGALPRGGFSICEKKREREEGGSQLAKVMVGQRHAAGETEGAAEGSSEVLSMPGSYEGQGHLGLNLSFSSLPPGSGGARASSFVPRISGLAPLLSSQEEHEMK